MGHVVKQIGQLRPVNTTPASLYSPAANTETIIHNVVICNTGAVAAVWRLFVDDDGTTYDETTALVWAGALGAGETDIFEVKINMNNSDGNLAVRTDTNNAFTFTANGEIFT